MVLLCKLEYHSKFVWKRKMRDTKPRYTDDAKAAIKVTWASIACQKSQKLITSTPRRRRIGVSTGVKGGPTKLVPFFMYSILFYNSSAKMFCELFIFILKFTHAFRQN